MPAGHKLLGLLLPELPCWEEAGAAGFGIWPGARRGRRQMPWQRSRRWAGRNGRVRVQHRWDAGKWEQRKKRFYSDDKLSTSQCYHLCCNFLCIESVCTSINIKHWPILPFLCNLNVWSRADFISLGEGFTHILWFQPNLSEAAGPGCHSSKWEELQCI